MALNRWQLVWKSLDEARIVVRVMVLLIFAAVIAYIGYVTHFVFEIVRAALEQGPNGGWSNLAVVLGAITSFAGVTIPVLASMFKSIWTDYRRSGTDWYALEHGERPTSVDSGGGRTE